MGENNLDIFSAYDKLLDIGVKKISEDTFIGDYSVTQILNKEFDKIKPVQMQGFLTILEREYDLDLSDYRNEYKEYISSGSKIKEEEPVVFKEKVSDKKKVILIMSLLVIFSIILVFFLMWFFTPSSTSAIYNEYDYITDIEDNITD